MNALAEQITFDFTTPKLEHENKRRFDAFHAANPEVFELLERFALARIEAGAKRVAVGHMCERLRYDTSIPTFDANSKFKLDNTYRAYYARLLIAKHPAWAEFIPIREQKHN